MVVSGIIEDLEERLSPGGTSPRTQFSSSIGQTWLEFRYPNSLTPGQLDD